MTARLSVAIAGAGMAGLASAALLHDIGHRVVIYDQFDEPRPIGSGIVLQPVGIDVLRAIDAHHNALFFGAPIRAIEGLNADTGRPALKARYGTGDAQGLAIHRGALFHVLLEAVRSRGVSIEAGRRITGREGQSLLFEGGARSPGFDLLIDASGAGSRLSPLRARPLSYGALWGIVDWPATTAIPADRLSQRYRRADRMVGILPVGRLPGDNRQLATLFWSLPVRDHQGWEGVDLTKWHQDVVDLWPEAAPFVEQVSSPHQMTRACYSHGSLRRPAEDGIVHLGDAAHRASPQLGQGANMALLDALSLARALETHPHCLSDAMNAHVAARRWHVRAYQTMSALFTPQYQGDSTALPVLRDRILYPVSRIPPVPSILTRLVAGRLIPPIAGL